MKNVSEDFKNVAKKIKQQDVRLTINAGGLQEISMMPAKIFNAIPVKRLKESNQVIAKDLTYSFDGQLFRTIMKQIDITVKNANEIKDKNVNFKYGLCINDTFEYVDLGDFYIKDLEDSKAKEEMSVTGYDRMLNFMRTFKQSELQLTWPCSMRKISNKNL